MHDLKLKGDVGDMHASGMNLSPSCLAIASVYSPLLKLSPASVSIFDASFFSCSVVTLPQRSTTSSITRSPRPLTASFAFI